MTVLRMLFCDYCGKSQERCRVLIQGRDEVHICDDCVAVCAAMVTEHYEKNKLRIEQPPLADAVDPQADSTGTPSTRDDNSAKAEGHD